MIFNNSAPTFKKQGMFEENRNKIYVSCSTLAVVCFVKYIHIYILMWYKAFFLVYILLNI